ncbi:MAG: 2-hydroxyacyl-CoA dehydratase, partial [Deltaproteobacteria bacterium]|nr:2-hydroxyacyl-CoA dehydratase [Deltaproteobacteria bacterium]
KFCDPYLYEFPYLKAELQRWGIPSLFLEGEYRGRAGGGLRTRVQAFLEMLEKKTS